MASGKDVLTKVSAITGYTVVAGGEPRLVDDDIYECLTALRAYPKAELYRNSDRELLAFTSGMGPGRGGREIE